jgi:vacuolar-type H+-ATPase subunit C/Vma6
MRTPTLVDLDYLLARLHARRSRLAEGARLEGLCRLRTLPELALALEPGWVTQSARELQRTLVTRLVQELTEVLAHLERSGRHLVSSLLARFQIENLKVLLRAHCQHLSADVVRAFLVPLPAPIMPDMAALLAAPTFPDFVAALPHGRARDRLAMPWPDELTPFAPFLREAALDAGYFAELLTAYDRLEPTEQAYVAPLLFHEQSAAQFMMALRGRFHYRLPAAALLRVAIAAENSAQTRWFRALLRAPDFATAAALGYGVVLDDGDTPLTDMAQVEILTWRRYLRLANQALRRSHMGIGAVAGYFGLRRVEVANLITLTEGIRLGMDEPHLHARLITPGEPEVAHA